MCKVFFFFLFLSIIILQVGFPSIWPALSVSSRSLKKLQTNLICAHLVVIPVGRLVEVFLMSGSVSDATRWLSGLKARWVNVLPVLLLMHTLLTCMTP